MPDPWTADVEVTADLARRVIEGQFSELGPVRLETLGIGWDNAAYLVNGRIVFRFPRRLIAADLLEREARILPLLERRLPARIPSPIYIGRPTSDYPWVFTGYPLIPGSTADRIPLTDEDRANLAEPIARFLSALHTIPVDSETRRWAPGDELRRSDISFRAPKVKKGLARIRDEENAVEVDAALAFIAKMTESEGPNAQGPTPAVCWVHGDLYSRHLLLDERNRLSGVIDWGDVHLGDPALDLSIAYSFLPPAARRRFRDSYGAVEESVWVRARFRALHYAPILIEYGRSTGDQAIESAGRDALINATQE